MTLLLAALEAFRTNKEFKPGELYLFAMAVDFFIMVCIL